MISSTLQALKVAVIPLRTFRVGGVHVWLVTTDTNPPQSRFSVQINSEVSEILVQETPDHSHPRGGKGQQKGKQKKAPPATATWTSASPSIPLAKPDDPRIEKLEQRFDKLEARQQTFENKVDSRFVDIQDSLRQLLAHATQRQRDVSGETPPPKQHKTS